MEGTTYPVDRGFDYQPIGSLHIAIDLPLLHEHALVPSYHQKPDGSIEVLSWALVHRSLVAPSDVGEHTGSEE